MRRRPHIIFIMSDEHDPAVMACSGDPYVQTASFDRLANHGVRFSNCYSNSPLCVPSRLSFTAGKYISRVGAWNNHSWLPSDDYPSIMSLLREGGYETVLCGKQHYDQTRRYGFEKDLIPEANHWFKTGRGSRRQWSDVDVNHENWQKRSADFRVGNESSTMNHDRNVTRVVVDFLKNREDERPLFLFVGYLAPHFPLTAPGSYYEKYRNRIPAPELPVTVPTNYVHERRGFGVEEVDDETVQRGRDLYWALTDWFDDELGRLLESIDSGPYARDTVVIYTSDHGENKGDHGLWWKNCMYDHAAKVPFIIRYPERLKQNEVRDHVCSLVDVVQTIADLAGVVPPTDWDGKSLLEVIQRPSSPWDDSAVSQYYGHNIASGITMFREGPFKYVYHSRFDGNHGPERELYDLETDPGELENLAALPQFANRIARMHQTLVQKLGEDPDEIELRCRSDFARSYRRDADP